jgi:hypothetical protein
MKVDERPIQLSGWIIMYFFVKIAISFTVFFFRYQNLSEFF